MSLKTFHIVFIVASFLLTAGFGVWGVTDYKQGGGTASLIMGCVSFVLTGALLVYGKYFLKKLRHISYL
jgi:hypothetical protein